MIVDLTTKISQKQLEYWLSKEENKHIVSGHIGTHLDVYNKGEIPLEYFKRNGILIDISSIAERRAVAIQDIVNYDIKKGDFVLFKTNRINNYAYGTSEYFNAHPQLSNEVIAYLLDKSISFIGIDCSGIRRGLEHEQADILCEENNCYVIENLSNLDNIHSEKFTVYTMWLEDKTMTGLKTRVIVEY